MECIHNDRSKVYELPHSIIWKCLSCGLVFNEMAEKTFDPVALYDSYYYKNEIAGRFNPFVELVVRSFRFFRAFKIFTVDPSARTILDIGSGRGWMLYYLKKYYRFTRAAGTQISKNALEFSKNILGLEMFGKDLLELDMPDDSFNIVTMWHVLEHVKDPEKYVDRINKLMTTHGKVIIEVPNFDSWSRIITGKYWLGMDTDYHLYYFTAKTLPALLRKYGLKIKMIHTFSLEYSPFISAQSIISAVTGSDHLFFKYLQDGKFSFQIMLHCVLFMVLFPVCFIINLLFYFSKRGEVLLVIAEK